MQVDILTLFPETVNAFLHESILGRAERKGLIRICAHQIRDYTENKQKQVDDYPYGGGFGCILMAQPLKSCLDAVVKNTAGERRRVIYLTPQGQPFTEETAKRLERDYDQLILICGHYEGIDERFIEECVDEEISIGDYVLTGGEIAAMAVTDAVCRLVPGVLADAQCYIGESHWDKLLEYPQYTRPELWEGRKVPEVLLQGNQKKIDTWRHTEQLRRTMEKRPDLFEQLGIPEKERQFLSRKLKGDIRLRKATSDDLHKIVYITENARAYLKKQKVDQWQGSYPNEESFLQDMEHQDLYVVTVDDEVAAFFVLKEGEDPCYAGITDGKWSGDDPYVTIHRFAVDRKFAGTGLSDLCFSMMEQEALRRGVRYIRVDTHKKNKSMQRVCQDNGFVFRGIVNVLSEPGHDTARRAYEKKLKKSSMQEHYESYRL